MSHHFEKKYDTYHLITTDTTHELINTFLQVEGKNFTEDILNCLLQFEKTKQRIEFSGNLFTLTVSNQQTTIQNKYDNHLLSVNTTYFIVIFKQYVALTQS